MNLEKLFIWITGIVIAFASTGQLDTLQDWIWKSQAKVIYESRSSNWGSPRFFNVPTVKGSNSSKYQNTHRKF
jgi:hypothetical protein